MNESEHKITNIFELILLLAATSDEFLERLEQVAKENIERG